MGLSLGELTDIAQAFQSFATPIGVALAGWWAYRKYIIMGESYPHIQSSAEIEVIGEQDESLIVEVRSVLENKGKVEHKIADFSFALNGITFDDPVVVSKKWRGQVDFPQMFAEGSFLPENFAYFAIGPSVTAKYSYVARVPRNTTFLMVHCWFSYSDDRRYSHSMEKTIKVKLDKLIKEEY